MVEAGLLDYETYLRCLGRASEKRAWILMTGTFESSLGWYAEKFNQWQGKNDEDARSFSLASWMNTVIFPGGRADAEILRLENQFSRERFLERFGGVPCPPFGLVFKEFRSLVHTKEIGFDADHPVYLWIDPGYAGAYAVEVAQIIQDRVFIVDEIYEQGFITEEIIQICRMRPWWAKVQGGAVDIAARQHQAMPAVAEVWQKEAGLRLSSQKVDIKEGIERLKTFLKPHPITGEANIVFNIRCKGIIGEFGGCPPAFDGDGVYRYKTDRQGTIIGDTPEDKNNHGIKAIIYGLVNRFGYAKVQPGAYRPKQYVHF